MLSPSTNNRPTSLYGLISLLSLTLATLLGYGIYHFGCGYSWDIAMFDFVRSWQSPFIQPIMTIITHLGSGAGLLIICCLAMWLGHFRFARQTIFLIVFGVVLSSHLKEFFQLRRPFLETNVLILEKHMGYPSGHSMTGVILAFLFYSVSSQKLMYCIIAVTIALSVALSRIYLGVHYFTDTIGGILVGVSIVAGGLVIQSLTKTYSFNFSYEKKWTQGIAFAFIMSAFLFFIGWGTYEIGKTTGFVLGVFLLWPQLPSSAQVRPEAKQRITMVLIGIAYLGGLFALRAGLKGIVPVGILGDCIRYSVLGMGVAFLSCLFLRFGWLKEKEKEKS